MIATAWNTEIRGDTTIILPDSSSEVLVIAGFNAVGADGADGANALSPLSNGGEGKPGQSGGHLVISAPCNQVIISGTFDVSGGDGGDGGNGSGWDGSNPPLSEIQYYFDPVQVGSGGAGGRGGDAGTVRIVAQTLTISPGTVFKHTGGDGGNGGAGGSICTGSCYFVPPGHFYYGLQSGNGGAGGDGGNGNGFALCSGGGNSANISAASESCGGNGGEAGTAGGAYCDPSAIGRPGDHGTPGKAGLSKGPCSRTLYGGGAKPAVCMNNANCTGQLCNEARAAAPTVTPPPYAPWATVGCPTVFWSDCTVATPTPTSTPPTVNPTPTSVWSGTDCALPYRVSCGDSHNSSWQFPFAVRAQIPGCLSSQTSVGRWYQIDVPAYTRLTTSYSASTGNVGIGYYDACPGALLDSTCTASSASRDYTNSNNAVKSLLVLCTNLNSAAPTGISFSCATLTPTPTPSPSPSPTLTASPSPSPTPSPTAPSSPCGCEWSATDEFGIGDMCGSDTYITVWRHCVNGGVETWETYQPGECFSWDELPAVCPSLTPTPSPTPSCTGGVGTVMCNPKVLTGSGPWSLDIYNSNDVLWGSDTLPGCASGSNNHGTWLKVTIPVEHTVTVAHWSGDGGTMIGIFGNPTEFANNTPLTPSVCFTPTDLTYMNSTGSPFDVYILVVQDFELDGGNIDISFTGP